MFKIKNLFPRLGKEHFKHPSIIILLLGFVFVLSGTIYYKVMHKPVPPVSRLLFSYNNELFNIQTKKTDLVEAVKEAGVNPYEQDEFSIPRDTKLTGQSLEFSIKISWPVVIYDDNKKIKGRTTKTEIKEILAQNKIETWPEDKVATELILDPVTTQGAGQMITIKRAPHFTVKVDGKEKEIRSWDNNVQTIIEKSGTKLNPNDIVMPALDNMLPNGTSVVIIRVEYVFTTKTEIIPFNAAYQGSTSLALGQSQVLVAGFTGSRNVTYKITYKDGEEVGRKVITSTTTKQKQDAKILRGAITGKCNWGPYYENHFGPYTTAFHMVYEHPEYKGRYILVTNMANGKSVKVKVVDAGPDNALLDLSTTAMREIGGAYVTVDGHIDNIMIELIE